MDLHCSSRSEADRQTGGKPPETPRQGIGDFINAFVDIIFPPCCPVCAVESEKSQICKPCTGSFKSVKAPLCTICGIPFISEAAENHPCGRCLISKPDFDRAASVFLFEGSLSEAIYRFKYAGKTSLFRSLGDLLVHHPVAHEGYDAIIPVPLHISRLRERGFNQSQLLAARVGKKLSIALDPLILERTRPTPPQAGMNRNDRIVNIRGAIATRRGANVKGKRFLLIDDVYTTGATTGECGKVLKKGGAKIVNVLTLARVVDRG